ncbi:MAG: trigger factor [Firmicutes bacterium]|nr:trigger factor [Bacillota bacterium]
MKTTLISKEKNIAKFTMDITAEEFEAAVINAYQANKDKYPVDGFRKGKAPRKIIENNYGEGIVWEDAVNEIFGENYPVALDELNLDVINRPIADFTELKKGEGFTITVEVECYPVIEVKDYKGVEIEKVEYEVTEEMVADELKAIQKRNARLTVVDRPAENGDTVVIDYAGFKGEEQFEGGTAERFPLTLGSGTFIPGFEEQLVGVAPGEEKDVELSFPEDYPAEDLAGAAVVFKCKVHEVKVEELPELDDEFVKDISEFDTLEEYVNDVKDALAKANAARAENEMKNEAIKVVYDKNEFDAPEVMIEDEMDARIKEFDYQLQYQGLGLDKYLELTQTTIEDVKEQIKEDCERAVKTKMLLSAVAEMEGFEVTDEEITKELEMMAIQYRMDAEQLRGMLGGQLGMVARDLQMRKAIDCIFANTVIK